MTILSVMGGVSQGLMMHVLAGCSVTHPLVVMAGLVPAIHGLFLLFVSGTAGPAP
jgi:hypothetical protein